MTSSDTSLGSEVRSEVRSETTRSEQPNGRRRTDFRRALQLALAAVWLLDGILQLQPVMFTVGPRGFSGMLEDAAGGNPHVLAQTITWNASVVNHHAVATNTAFAFIQILIGLGI